MKCEKCGQDIREGEEHDYNDQAICDDCYMDALSPTRTCDPWAVYTAKSISDKASGALQLNDIQTKILDILEETGGLEFSVLVERIGEDHRAVEREFAALRHIEKVRAEMREDKKVMRLW